MSSLGKTASKGAMDAAKKLVGHWAFWLVLAIILLVLAYKAKDKVAKWFTRASGTDHGHTDGHVVNQVDEARLMRMGDDLLVAIDGFPAWNDRRDELFLQASVLNDTELAWLADYYDQVSDGDGLLADVESEYGVFGEGKERLLSRLRALTLN